MRKLIAATMLIWLVCLCGCLKTVSDGKTAYSIDPNEVAKYEKPVETALDIMTALSPFFPVLIPIVAGMGGIYGTYKLQKPKLVKAQTKSELYHNTTGSLVAVLEKFKETNPTEYAKLKEKLEKTIGRDAENVIRALRGLQPKT